MKKILLVLIILVVTIGNLRAGNWMTSFEDAQKMALATDKLMLVDFWAIWCGPCKQMDAESWSQDEVALLMQNFVPVKIDIDSHQQLAMQYDVEAIPFLFIMDGNGKVLYKEMSYKDKNQVIDLLKKYAVKTTFLKQHLINYHNNPCFATAFQLASRYNDFSIYLDEAIRYDVLDLSSEYFKDSKKLLRKSDTENKKVFEEKYDLYDIQKTLILKSAKKAQKLLDKIEIDQLEEVNTSFFYFLNYLVAMKMNDKDQANEYQTKLNDRDKTKAAQFLNAI